SAPPAERSTAERGEDRRKTARSRPGRSTASPDEKSHRGRVPCAQFVHDRLPKRSAQRPDAYIIRQRYTAGPSPWDAIFAKTGRLSKNLSSPSAFDGDA